MKVYERDKCRISNGAIIPVFDLGQLPVSCFPSATEGPVPSSPITLCLCPKSSLLQLSHTVDPDEMYEQYWYMSGINESMRIALSSIVGQALSRSAKLQSGDIVLDIASNDGTLLKAYPDNLFRVGIDPAKNIKPISCDLHINTYFNKEVFKASLGSKKAKVITSIAMFYDLEDPVQFAKDVSEILSEDGLWIIELSYLPTMLERNSIDTICAEHLEYYSLKSLEYILSQTDLRAEDVELNEVNGGSFRVYIRHKKYAKETPAIIQMRIKENELRLDETEIYQAFGRRVQKNKADLIHFLQEQKRLGKRVLGYGASTKGNTIMAYYGIGPDLIDCVADRNPIKWGRQTVTRIPIISEKDARLLKPDYFLVFPYHFMPEFLTREQDFLKSGGRFVSPIPSLSFYSSESPI